MTQYWANQKDKRPFFSDTQRKRGMCVPWTLYVTGYPHNSPSIAVVTEGRARPIIPSPDRENISSSKRRLLINISPDGGLAGNATGISNAGIGWCTRNLQTPCFRASVYTQHTSHLTCTEMREERKGCGRGSVPLGHW